MRFKQLSEEKFIDVAGKLRLLGLFPLNGKNQAEFTPMEIDLIQLIVLLSGLTSCLVHFLSI